MAKAVKKQESPGRPRKTPKEAFEAGTKDRIELTDMMTGRGRILADFFREPDRTIYIRAMNAGLTVLEREMDAVKKQLDENLGSSANG